MISLQGVTKHYDDKVAVDDVHLAIESGTVFGLIGPNGAGKTTTLKMLATLVKPDSGSIEVDGHDVVGDVREVRRLFGYMPDQFGMFRGLSCVEYLEFFGRMYDLDGSELRQRVDDVLELTDLTKLRDDVTSGLSTGVRQRLALAKTLLHDPKILYLDEPASGLDPRARIEIRSLLGELAAMGKTIVISSHILADLEEICDEVGMIEKGRLVWSGNLETLAADSVAESEKTGRKIHCIVEVNEPDRDSALQILEALDGVDVTNSSSKKLDLELDDRRGNRILEALIRAEIEVTAFRLERVSLETLFLHRTTGEIS